MTDEQKSVLLWKARREIEELSAAAAKVVKNEEFKRQAMANDPQLAEVVEKCMEVKRQIRRKELRNQILEKNAI